MRFPIRARRYSFQMRGPRGSMHPMMAVRIGPVILTFTWFSRGKHKRALGWRSQALLDRLSGAPQ